MKLNTNYHNFVRSVFVRSVRRAISPRGSMVSSLIKRSLAVGLIMGLLLAIAPAQLVRAEDAPTQETATDAPTKTYLPQVRTWVEHCDKQNPASPFGVQMYGQTSLHNPWHKDLVDSGAKWVRVPVQWREVEPQNVTPDQYKWQAADGAVFAAVHGCFNIIGTFGVNPDWAASTERGPLDKTSLDELKEVIGALVERYDGDGYKDGPGSMVVNDWEIYNEPDAGPVEVYAGWGKSPGKYAEMLAAIYPVIKEANPNAKVLFGGIAADWFEQDGGPFVENFLDKVLKAGGGKYFDVMNFHSFVGEFTPRYPSPGLFEKIEYIRGILQANGVNKPIVVTESGWRSNTTPSSVSTPERQARYVTTLYAQGIAGGLDVLVHWMLWDPGGPYPDETGLVTNDVPGVRKKSFDAYQVAVEMLEDVNFVRKFAKSELANSNMEVYKFTDPVKKTTLYVAWLNPVANESKLANLPKLRLSTKQVTTRDIYGKNQKTLRDQDDGATDGFVNVPITNQPVYIIISQ